MLGKILKGIGVIVVLFIIICGLAVACGGNGSNVSNDPGQSQSQENADYEFTEQPSMTNEGYGCYSIKGILKNNTNIDKEYVQISFILYDKDGNNIGTAFGNANCVKAGKTWKFNASGIVTDENSEAVSFELDSVDGF